LNECIEHAQATGKHGVVMVTSSGVWLADKKLFLKHGFKEIGQAPPSFSLLVKQFANYAPMPSFPTNWDERARHFGDGLTILRSHQCPYIPDAVNIIVDFFAERGVPTREIELTSAQEVQELSPSSYGLFGVVYNGKLLSYHYLGEKDLVKLVDD
jgi:hypothetical protein